MAASRRCALVIVLLLATAACGGGSGGLTTTSVPTTTTTTTTAATTTAATTTTSSTVPPDTGPLAGLIANPVADPLLGTASYDMEYGDATRTFVASQAPVTAAGGKLVLAPFEPAPATTGIAADQILLEAWIAPHDGVAPRAIVLFGLGGGGWNPYVAIDADSILEYLLTSTDYLAKQPEGPVDVRTIPTVFDWAGSAHFIADVAVFAHPDAGIAAYEGQIECTYVGTLECTTLSDDGILRPGDEGEPVEALQEALADLGFYTGAGEGLYDEATEEAVRLFQRDYRLEVDGKAGPQTQDLLAEVASGESDIVMASREGVGEVLFGTAADTARPALNAIFGSPDASTGWFSSACSGADWLEITWDGFTAIFTDRNGSRQFDGWKVDDLQDLPSWLYFAGGIRPSWRWADFEDMGAGFDPEYGAFWYHHDLGYNNGRFVNPPSDPPAAGARISGFGTGTGAFVSC